MTMASRDEEGGKAEARSLPWSRCHRSSLEACTSHTMALRVWVPCSPYSMRGPRVAFRRATFRGHELPWSDGVQRAACSAQRAAATLGAGGRGGRGDKGRGDATVRHRSPGGLGGGCALAAARR